MPNIGSCGVLVENDMNSETTHSLLSIALVADLHYAPITVGNRYCSESLTKLKAAVDVFQERHLDLVVCLGDVIDESETIEGSLSCVRDVVQALDVLPAEKHYVLGNHDVSELTKAQFLAAVGAESSCYSFDCRGVHIVILDSNFNPDGTPFAPGNLEWNDAWVGEEQICWLREDLAGAGERPTLVFCHANLDHRVRENGELNGHIVKDAAKVREVLEAAGNVKAVIQGHDHAGNQSTINGIPYIVLRGMVEGSGLAQNAYALLSLMSDGAIQLEGFGQQSSMRVG
jgi:3',5'-cyclic AMP phosphodiesterase CpdA